MYLLLFPMTMSAYDFEVDGLYFKLTGPHSVGVTYYDANYNSYSGDITIPSSIEVDGESYTVSSIEPNAFRGSTDLTSVTIPQSVGSIKSAGFRDCTSLTSVSIPNRTFTLGNRAFMGCTSLETIHLTIHITSLPDSLFYGCTGLTTMNLFNNYHIETVGNEVFSGCTSLSSISMPGRVQSYGRGVLRGCTSLEYISLRGSVKEIAPAMFSGCTSLTTVVIPDSITAIGDSVFSHCTALTSIDLPDSLETVGDYAFYYCRGIAQLDLPDKVSKIGRGAFSETGLTSFVIPEGITEIEYSTFLGCYDMKDIVFPSTLKTIGPQAFMRCGFESIVIPNTVTKLSWAAFSDCSRLQHVQLSDSLTRLEERLFSTTNLNEIVIPQSVTSISYGVFTHCFRLGYVFIPKSVTSIADGAFYETSGLADIIVEEGNPVYDSRDNCNAIIETATNILLKGGKKTVIPNTVTSIANGAFNWTGIAQVTFPESVTSVGTSFVRCTNLQEVNISKSLTSIATRAFENCYNLTTINIDSDNPVYDSRDSCNAIIETATNTVFQGCPGTKIPEGITAIAPYAFYGMASGDQYFTYGISSITFPSTLTYIGHEAFGNGNRLLTVISLATVPPTLENENVFNTNCYYDATLHVPASALDAYQAADGWRNFRMILPLGDNGEPMEQTDPPYRDGWTYSPNYDYIAIGLKNRPTEPDATIYYHIAKNPYTVQPIDSTEWTVYTEPVRFTEIGTYTFEYYAISPGKLMSTVTRSSVYVDTFDPHDYLVDFDFRVDGLHYKILSDSTAGLCERYRDLVDYGLMSCYYGDIVIPETVTFEDVTYTVTAIMKNTFLQSQLTSISMPNTLTHIGDSAFYEAELPEFTLPESVTHIGKEAFVWSSLTSVVIPASVEYIGTAAFGTLDTLAVAQNNRHYDSRGYCNAIIETATNKLIIGCENTTIPTSVEAIGDSAFFYTEYFNYYGNMVLPNAVRTIGKMAFGGYSVYSLEIGKGVEFIDTCAFYNCWDLWEITCHSIYPPEAYNAFECEDLPWQNHNVYENAVLRVPAQSLNRYQRHAEWGRFTHIETFDYEGNYDVNGDGKVTISDVTDLINLLLKGEEPYYADVNGDGYVRISDVTDLITMLLSGNYDTDY